MDKKGKTMKQKRISFGQGKGSLTHNNREFMADNVDPIRTPQNITFVRQPIGEAYEQLFAESTERYNAKQKLAEIDSIETGKTVFGGKVTVSQEDWQNVTDLARKEVASQKQTKKLRKERDEAVRERDELKAKLSAASSELAAYKKADEQKGLFTREKLKKEAARISREDELSRELRKAKAFISACGLSADFQQYKYNSTTRKNVLE